MVTVLHQRQLCLDGLSFILMTSPYAEALAVDAPPSVEVAMTTSRLIEQGRSDGTLKPFGTLVVAFSGCAKADRLVVDVLREACVYLASDDLKESASDNALSFLAYVEARMPEIMKIVGSAQRS